MVAEMIGRLIKRISEDSAFYKRMLKDPVVLGLIAVIVITSGLIIRLTFIVINM